MTGTVAATIAALGPIAASMPIGVGEPRCRNCRWWDLKHECHHPKVGANDNGPAENDELSYWADAYGLSTGPNFGCVHFESKHFKPTESCPP